ncbi:TRAP transporter small permease [Thalassospira alkalitolerans]|uniref:TRAP transporter small permease n=1 Tax=Thalassospira alkalitolerans TaxID=1293890 RepID=UPI0030ED4B98
MSNAIPHSSLPIDLPDEIRQSAKALKSAAANFPPPPDVEPIADNGTAKTKQPVPPKGAVSSFIATVHFLSKICGVVAASMFAIAMFIICQLVFMRYVLNASTTWQTEAVIYLMIGATLVGLPYVQMIRGHVNVDLLPLYLRRGPRKVLAIITMLCGIGISALFGYYGLELVIEAFEGGWLSETIWAVPLWKPFSSLPIGFGLLFLQFCADLLGLLTQRTTPFDISEDTF